MELMERVREMGASASIGDDELNAARQALLREVARAERTEAAPARRRAIRWIGGSALAGGLAATALVIGLVVVPTAAPTASAADVLEQAAEVTLTTDAVSPAPGQYIRIQETATSRLGWTADADAPDGGWWDGRPSATEATVVQARSLYVPADRSGDWVRDYNESFEVIEISGPDADAARPALTATHIGAGIPVEVYPNGLYNEPELAMWGIDAPRPVNGLECYYDEMPRDPAALAQWVRDYAWSPGSVCPPPRLTEPENFNLAPPDLRAAMFRALALSDGARVVRADGDVTTIAFPDGGESDWMQTVDIDTESGLMVGRGNLDDDSWSSRVAVSIVDGISSEVAVPAS